IDFNWAAANPVPTFSTDTTNESFAVRWTGTIAAPAAETENFQIHLPSCYPCEGKVKFAIYFDGKPLESISPPSDIKAAPSASSSNPHYSIPFADTKPHRLRIEYIQSGKIEDGGITFE